MTWRNEDRVNPVRQKFGRQAAFIDIKCRNAGSRQMERSADIRMARILAYDMRTPRQKQMADDPKRVLCANRNQYLVRLRAYPSARQRTGADVIDKFNIVRRGEITCHEDEIFPSKRTPGAIAPCGQVEQGLIHLAIKERIAVFSPIQRLADGLGDIEAGRSLDDQSTAVSGVCKKSLSG